MLGRSGTGALRSEGGPWWPLRSEPGPGVGADSEQDDHAQRDLVVQRVETEQVGSVADQILDHIVKVF